MAGVIRIQPDMMQAGHSWFPVPYVLLLRDLARINAGRTLPRIPQTATEAQVRLAAERRRVLLTRRASDPLVARSLHAVGRLDVSHHSHASGEDQQHEDPRSAPCPAPRLGHAARVVPLALGTILSPQGLPVSRRGESGAADQQHSHQDPRQ